MTKPKAVSDNPLVEAATKGLASQLERVEKGVFLSGDDLKNARFRKHIWNFMHEGDINSPKVMQLDDGKESTKRFLIYYPENSTPYPEDVVDKFKLARILDGEIWDEITDKKYEKDDLIYVKPGEKFLPKTKDQDCHVLVEVSHETIKKNPNFIYRNCGNID